jgi:ribosomal protein L19
MEVEIYQRIDEGNKTRVQRFRGLVIDTAGKTPLEKTKAGTLHSGFLI